MSKRLPLEVRKNYTIKDRGADWEITCDVCSQKWSLKKPEKGPVHGGNVLHLIDHAASHPLPQDEEPAPELIPISHIQTRSKFSFSSPKHPISYKVEIKGNITKVSRFSPPHYVNPLHITYCQVSKKDGGHSVLLYAANTKHAELVGKRLIREYISSK